MGERCAERLRRAATTIVACAALATTAACGGGGGGGGSGGGDAAPQTQTSSVSLAWAAADGPVAGYDLWVARDGGSWSREQSVPAQHATLRGEPGESARLAVGAYDSRGRRGPISVPSPAFVFPDPDAPASSSSSAVSGSGTGSSGASSSPALPAASGDPDPQPEPDPQAVDPTLLAGAILWQSGRVLRVTSPWLETLLVFATPSPAHQLAGTGDLDGDGLDDPIWIDTSGHLSYTPLAALASRPNGAAPVGIGRLAAGAQLLGSADFDGDGRGDLLVKGADAQVDAWLTHPGGPSDVLPLGNAGQATVVGLRDFDGNGSDDVAWRGADGSLAIWLTDGATLELALDPALQVVAAGDFDGDALAELAVRDASGGLLLIFPLSTTPLAPVATGVGDALGWSPLGAGDLDRDGTEDLAFSAADSLRSLYLPGEDLQTFDPATWQPVALLR